VAKEKILKYWFPVIVYMLAIFINSSLSTVPQVEMPFFDKIMHLACYAVLGCLLMRAMFNYGYQLKGSRLVILAVLFGSLYGVTDEIHQMFVPGRTAEIMDVVSDSLGTAMGVGVYNSFFNKKMLKK